MQNSEKHLVDDRKHFYTVEDTPEGLLISFCKTEKGFQKFYNSCNSIFDLHDIVRGKKVIITGKGQRVAYFALGYYLTIFKATSITYKDGVNPVEPFEIKSEEYRECEHKNWYGFESKMGYDDLWLEPSNALDGDWDWCELLPLYIPGEMPSPKAPEKCLHISGNGKAYTFASLGVYAALAKKEDIRFINEAADYQFVFTPEKVDKIKVPEKNKNGFVIGILGDPNSGKSVFAKSFWRCLSNILPEWCETWIYDCDLASRTQDWYLKGCQSGDEKVQKHVAEKRREDKSAWDDKKEDSVAKRLAWLKQNQDIIIADMPGGRHPHDGQDFPPERIPKKGKRAEMMKACDAFIIIYRLDKPESLDGWKEALAEYSLEGRIVAEFVSCDPKPPFEISKFGRDENGIFKAEIKGLDRTVNTNDIVREMVDKIDGFVRYVSYFNVIVSAKAAVAKAFLTGNKGTRYGAAVRSFSTGRIFTSGQYSSFNHSTNIHAEMGALMQAAMAGEPDVDVLCIACSDTESAIPCGVCRQVILEHSQRTNRDFDVVMTSHNGKNLVRKVSELLSEAWRTKDTMPLNDNSRMKDIRPKSFTESNCCTGAYCMDSRIPGKSILELVWDAKFMKDHIYVKLKYEQQEDKWQKLPHAFTEAAQYQRYLLDGKYNSLRFPGASIVHIDSGVKFRNPVLLSPRHFENFDPNIYDSLQEQIFAPAGIDITENVFITNSRLLNLQRPDSDYDLLVMGMPEEIMKLRQVLASLFQCGAIGIVEESGSWKCIKELFPEGTGDGGHRIISECRYCETFVFQNVNFSLMFALPQEEEEFAFKEDAENKGRKEIIGTVIDSKYAPYKRSVSKLSAMDGREYRILCYHKVGNMLKEGDVVAISGNLFNDVSSVR